MTNVFVGIYLPNERPNIFMRRKNSQRNVWIYLLSKNPRIFEQMNIFVHKYSNIFKYPNIRYTLCPTYFRTNPCLSVCATFCGFLNVLLIPFKNFACPIDWLQKIPWENLGQDIGLRIYNFGSEIVKKCCAFFVCLLVFATHCWLIYVTISSRIWMCIVRELAGSLPLTCPFPAAHLDFSQIFFICVIA